MFHAKEINSDIATSAWNKSHYASLFCSPELLDKLGTTLVISQVIKIKSCLLYGH